MMKKGLGMLAGLTVLSVAAAGTWASSMYAIQTKLTNDGGSVQVRNYNAQTGANSIKYTNFTTSGAVQVVVTPDSLHKIIALTQNGQTVAVGDGNSAIPVQFYKSGTTTQSLVATFAVKSASNVVLKTWQLQTKNNNVGGTITTTRGTDTPRLLSASGQLVLKNYTDTTPVVVTVAPSAGYTVKNVQLNGADVALDSNGRFTIDPAASAGKVNTVIATYQKNAYTVSAAAGISPVNTYTTYGGSASLTATPTGSNNLVTGVSVSGTADVVLTDANNNVVTAPLKVQGPVKINLSNIKSNVSVTATYGMDTTGADLKNCTTSCHLAASAAVQAVPAQWQSSRHYQVSVSCTTCHITMPGPALTSANNCEKCHTGSNAVAATSTQVAAWQKSLHTIANNHFENVSCAECHNEHTLVATATDDKTDSCAGCHTYRDASHNYSIYTDASKTTLKAPHGGGVPAYMGGTGGANDNASVGWPAATTSYLTRGAICTDCHGHNNSINAGFAEGAHGEVSSDPMNPFNHYDWSKQGNDGTRQNGSCDRCHTAAGFMKLLGATNDPAYARLNAGIAKQGTYNATIANYQPNNVLICVGCHTNLDSGALRTDAAPMGNNAAGQGAGQAISQGYFALFSSSAAVVDPSKTRIQIAFPGYKNSSICIPCHSGRSTAAVFTAVIDRAAATNPATNKPYGNYSTISTSYYQHGKNIGQNFISQGAYDFTGKLAAITANGPSAHSAVKMGSSDTQGPCVGCHYSSDKTHSLEVAPSTASCVAAQCHPTVPDVDAAKANFDAGVAALDVLIRSKFASLQPTGGDLATERANVRFGRFGKAAGVAADAATAKMAYGAWYNWQLLAVYDNAAFVHNPRYARQVLNDTLAYLQLNGAKPGPYGYSGSTVSAAIAAAQALQGGISADQATAAQGFITAPGCQGCHAQKVTTFTTATGYHYSVKGFSCANCHTEQHQVGTPTCSCHGDVAGGSTPVVDAVNAPGAKCADCHGSTDVHSMKAADLTKGCINCHAAAIQHPGNKVADNNGVRAITTEFSRWSHHVTGATLQDAHCAACHLEGKAVNGAIVVDTTKHMADAKTHLRNVDTDEDMAWDPANPDHGKMDNFCLSCHDANGATSAGSQAVQGVIVPVAGATASALNPFGDTISNQYDKMLRGRVVDADGQFSTGNASHHAVKGAKYTGRVREGASRVIANPAAFSANSSATMAGERKTLFEAGRFNDKYATIGNTGDAASLGDDSTLHCGDCHTVGQYAPGSATNADGSKTTVAIGAHGAENEYMLRNSIGTNELHRGANYDYYWGNRNADGTSKAFVGVKEDGTVVAGVPAVPVTEVPTQQPFLVCYNCHVYAEYGSVYFSNTAAGGREGGHAEAEHTRGNFCNGPYNTSGSGRVTTYTAVYGKQVSGVTGTFQGITNFNYGRLQPGTAAQLTNGTTGTSAPATAGVNGQAVGGANIFQIQCMNCHNGGPANGFGGIHGTKVNTYTDGNGNGQLPRRFLPGLGNVGFVPGDPAIAGDAKWEQEKGTAGPGCYTLSTASTSSAKNMPNPTNAEAGGGLNTGSGQVFGTWGSCNDHGAGAGTKTGVAGDAFERTIVRPVTY